MLIQSRQRLRKTDLQQTATSGLGQFGATGQEAFGFRPDLLESVFHQRRFPPFIRIEETPQEPEEQEADIGAD